MLTICDTRVLRGPNVWARVPVIHLRVDLGDLEDRPTNMIPEFTDRLVALLPSLGSCLFPGPSWRIHRAAAARNVDGPCA